MSQSELATLLAVIALVISAASALYTRRQANAARRLAAIDESRREEEIAARKEREREKALAELEATQARFTLFADRANGGGYTLRIKNVGGSTARQIAAAFNDSKDGLPRPEEFERRPLPFGDLTPGASLSRSILDDHGSTNYSIQLSWQDGSGKRTEIQDVVV